MGLCKQIDLLKGQIDEIENKCRGQSYQLAQLNQDYHDQKSASTQIRYVRLFVKKKRFLLFVQIG